MNIPDIEDPIYPPDFDDLIQRHRLDPGSLHVKAVHGREGERMLRCELAGLTALSDAGMLRVPTLYGLARRNGGVCLVMERIRVGRGSAEVYEEAGRMLARMHKTATHESAGFYHDNYIGAGEQKNGWMDQWPDFFAERRIVPQVERARRRGLLSGTDVSSAGNLCRKLNDILPAQEPMSLLHGDLWGGNLLTGSDGRAFFIDPAVYFGHREADLAMTRLFGGFPPAFYSAYEEEWPLLPGSDERVGVYNLYHLLNHLNLFGVSYRSSVRDVLKPFSGV